MIDALSDLAVRSSLALAAAGVLAVGLRRRAASVQALLLTTALVASLAVPVAMALLPAVEVAVPWMSPGVGTAEPLAATAPARPATAVTRAEPTLATSRVSTPSLAMGAPNHEKPSAAPAAAGPSAWPLALALVWLTGTLAIAARVAGSHIRLARLVRRARPFAGEGALAALAEVRAGLGLGRRVGLRTTAELNVPIVSGLLAPTVVLPDEAGTWEAPLVRDVLRHELAHVARLDAAGQLAGRLACACYWFNPLAWALAARAAALRERACDDEVLRAGTRASDYATRLLALAGLAADDAPPHAALAMASPARIRERIVRVLDPAAPRDRSSRTATGLTLLAGLAVVAGLSALQPAARAAALVPVPFDLVGTPANAPAATPLPARPPAAPAQAEQAPPLCSGELNRSSSSTNENQGVRRWRVELSGDRCDVDLRVNGRIQFNEDFTDVAGLDPGGVFRLDATIDGVRRHLEIQHRDGSLERTYQVDGRTAEWDAAARDWFARFLIALDRRTGVGADVRLPRLLEQGGVDAVLAETGRITSDHARSTYYEGLLEARRLSPDERRLLIEQAARLVESDHYATQTLERVVAQGRLEDPRERDAVVSMIAGMDSDHYRAEAIEALGDGPIDAAQTSAILDVLLRMDSDHYRTEVLTWLGSVAPAGLDTSVLLKAISAMDSDHYRTESIEAVGRRSLSSTQAASLLPIIAEMDSAHYQREVLGELLGVALAEAQLLTAVGLISDMDSDHYQAEALGDVIANRGATDRVRAAVRDAAGMLSRHYRDEVLRRIGG